MPFPLFPLGRSISFIRAFPAAAVILTFELVIVFLLASRGSPLYLDLPDPFGILGCLNSVAWSALSACARLSPFRWVVGPIDHNTTHHFSWT